MAREWFYGANVGLMVALVSAPSGAQQAAASASSPGIELEIAAGARWLDLPEVQAGLEAPDAPIGATEGDLQGWGLDVSVGRSLSAGADLLDHGARVQARWRMMKADARDETPSTTGAYGQIPVDGSDDSDGGGPSLLAISEVDFSRYDLDLVYELALLDGPIGAAVRIGPSYSRVNQDLAFFSSPSVGWRIDDELETNYYGVVLGLGLSPELPFGLALNADLDVDLLAGDSDLDVRQDFGGSPIHASDDTTRFAKRVRGRLGAGFTLDISDLTGGCLQALVIEAQGSAEWSSYLPTVEHAIFDANPFRSRLAGDDAVTYGADGAIRFLF